jgi:hypothetical protein
MKPTMLTMSLCMGLTVLGCAYGPTGPEPSSPARLAAASQATGRLVIQLAAPTGRKTLAFAEDLQRIEVTLRRRHGDAVETVGQATLTGKDGWKFEVFNLLPGSYDLQLIAYDRGDQAVHVTAPAPYQVGPYEVRAYELAQASVTLPLRPTHVITFEYPTPTPTYTPTPTPTYTPTPKPTKTPNEHKPNNDDKPTKDNAPTAGATPTPTPQPEQNQPLEGGDS